MTLLVRVPIAYILEFAHIGDPMDDDTDVSALIDRGETERVEQWIQEAVDEGAVVATGGRMEDGVLVPTVLTDVTFVHWPYDPSEVAGLLPAGTHPDVHDGAAYVGLVAFRMRSHGEFLETNVRTYTIVVEPEEDGGYYVTVPALPGCFTRGRTIEECEARAAEAIEVLGGNGYLKDATTVVVDTDEGERTISA